MTNKSKYILTSVLFLVLVGVITLHFTGHRNAAFWWASILCPACFVSAYCMRRR